MRLLMLLLLGQIILFCPTAFAAPRINAENVKQFFDASFALQRNEHLIAGATVSVVHDGKVIFKKGYGYADVENRVAVDPDRSLFRIASITKTFIWTAIMQLHESGQLNLDDKVNDHLNAFKIPETFPEPVRIRHLLAHTAGFEDQAIGMNARTIEETKSLERYLSEHMPERVTPAGQHASYSNWGTTLAAYIVDQVTGEVWDDYVTENILSPLHMNSTNAHQPMPPALMEQHAKSYVFSGGNFVAKPFEAMNDAPAGVMSTTADDMSRYMLAHLNQGEFEGRRILKSSTAELMQSPLFAPHPDLPPMLHGFYRSDRNGQVVFGHGGDTNQFHSNLSLLPQHKLGLFVSFNADSASEARSRLIPAFIDHFFPGDHLKQASAPAAVELSDYEGEYIPLRSNVSTMERLGILVTGISVHATEHTLQVSNREWIPVAENEFEARYRDRKMIFTRDDSNAVTHVTIGAPLGSFRKVTGMHTPGFHRIAIANMMLLATLAIVGYGYRSIKPGRDVGLPALPVLAAWIHSLLVFSLCTILAVTLAGDVEEFVLGVPATMNTALNIMAFNAIPGIYVIWSAFKFSIQETSTTGIRVRYSAVALMALINLWFCWYFNIFSYPFSGMQVIS